MITPDVEALVERVRAEPTAINVLEFLCRIKNKFPIPVLVWHVSHFKAAGTLREAIEHGKASGWCTQDGHGLRSMIAGIMP